MRSSRESTEATSGRGNSLTRSGSRGSSMRIDVVTLFPDMIEHAVRYGVTGRALERGLWRLGVWNPRDFVADNYRTIDDRPYGGGPGMVMLAEPLAKTLA